VRSHVVSQNSIKFVFQTPLTLNQKNITDHHVLHGDGVKDVTFAVEDARAVWK
jgi:4-hydroxyphenylpyruvate dioxygenase